MQHILPNQVDEHWDRVKAGLQRIINKAGTPGWTPGDVLCALASGSAHLALIDDDAWLIWQRYPGDDGKGILFIWACEGIGLKRHGPKVFAELQDMARFMKCRVVRMISPRKGWAAEDFFRMTGYVYEHEVREP